MKRQSITLLVDGEQVTGSQRAADCRRIITSIGYQHTLAVYVTFEADSPVKNLVLVHRSATISRTTVLQWFC